MNVYRPYQQTIGRAVIQSIVGNQGLTFSVEIARQGGKNELSSLLELALLLEYHAQSKNMIKCSPTFKPQTLISMQRLKDKINSVGLSAACCTELGYIVKLDQARAIFLSADDSANVVGNTAHILLEVDEAQDVAEDKYIKDFKPMGSTTNVTTVLYGTTWDESSLLEKVKQANLELQKKDGLPRHFRFDWQEVAKYNDDYLRYVEGERARLGENHPLFLTQYRLLSLQGGGGFLNASQKAQLQAWHLRQRLPEAGKVYVAGIDLGGEAENSPEVYLKGLKPRNDSTVVTIAEVTAGTGVISAGLPACDSFPAAGPQIKIVEHYAWQGQKHTEVYGKLVDLLKNTWHCRRVVVDATGIGQPLASFLQQALGSRVVPFTFSQPSKSDLGFNLLAAINAGRLKMYAADNSAQFREFWFEMDKAKSHYRPSQTMNFFVDAADGHDDYLMSLALLVKAAEDYAPREARGS